MWSKLARFVIALNLVLMGACLVGCEEGPAEDAGEKIDEVIDDADG